MKLLGRLAVDPDLCLRVLVARLVVPLCLVFLMSWVSEVTILLPAVLRLVLSVMSRAATRPTWRS